MEPAVQFEGVTKTFSLEHDRARSFKEAFVGLFRGESGLEHETLVALDNVSFTVPRGQALALVGPNGTGKSTVLKLAARILEPSSGQVTVNGRLAALLELGAGFHPDLSGRENLYLNGSLMGLSRREVDKRFREVVDFAELERFIDMPVKHYSSGMYMRLAFSAAIHVDPEILLVDEVLAVGDQAFQSKCRDRIAELRKTDLTLILVTHDNTVVRELCDHAIWLEQGRVQVAGATDEVVEAYYLSVMAREQARLAADHKGPPVVALAKDRWGSHEVEITAVETLDADGQPQPVFRTGESLTVRLHYQAHERLESPVFGLAVYRNDGVLVYGPNTLDAGLAIPFVEGTGTLDYRIESLPLLSGTYELSASVYDRTASHPYDHHHRRYPFHVRDAAPQERVGIVEMRARWRHCPDPSESSPAVPASTAEEPTLAR